MMRLTRTAIGRWFARAGSGALACVAACHPPAATQPPAGAASQPPRPSVLPEPGVYVLERVRGMALPADLRPTGPDQPAGGYKSFKRVLAGWLYLTPDRDYQTIICADLVDSAGRKLDTYDGGLGGKGNKYWASGGRVYFSNIIADGPVDSIAVRVHGDTVVFGREVYVLDRTAVLPPYPPILAYVCHAIRASPAEGRPPGT